MIFLWGTLIYLDNLWCFILKFVPIVSLKKLKDTSASFWKLKCPQLCYHLSDHGSHCMFLTLWERERERKHFILKIKMFSTMLSPLRSWFSSHVLDTLSLFCVLFRSVENEREKERCCHLMFLSHISLLKLTKIIYEMDALCWMSYEP